MTNSNSLHHLSPVWTHMTNISPERGEGIYLYTEDGTRYTDFTSGIGVTNTGHCHPRVVAALQKQAATLIHGQINIVAPRSTIELADLLNTITPKEIDCFFFSNSGAEAVEASVKLARSFTKRTNIIVFQGSFHGRTAQAMAMTTSKTVYRQRYQPLPAGIFVAPFPNSYYYGWDEDTTIDFCLHELKTLLKSQTAPEETAAMIIEPVLGEGGYVPAPNRFLQGLREICDQYGILLIADEVQTGFGRAGKLFAFEHADIVPDIVVMAKGLGSGVPISGIGASREIMEQWTPGTHGGTYGGNGFAAAGAVETIKVILDEDLVGNSTRMGQHLMEGLLELQAEFPIIGDVRGLGLMVGVEFSVQDHQPDADVTKGVLNASMERNLMLLNCGTYGNVIRWIPPLVVNKQQIDEALTTFGEALAQASGEREQSATR